MARKTEDSSNIGSLKGRDAFRRAARRAPEKKLAKPNPELQNFHEMEYEELAKILSVYSPHVLPLIRKIKGFVKKNVIVCKKHSTPYVVIENEVQPCYVCQNKR